MGKNPFMGRPWFGGSFTDSMLSLLLRRLWFRNQRLRWPGRKLELAFGFADPLQKQTGERAEQCITGSRGASAGRAAHPALDLLQDLGAYRIDLNLRL